MKGGVGKKLPGKYRMNKTTSTILTVHSFRAGYYSWNRNWKLSMTLFISSEFWLFILSRWTLACNRFWHTLHPKNCTFSILRIHVTSLILGERILAIILPQQRKQWLSVELNRWRSERIHCYFLNNKYRTLIIIM